MAIAFDATANGGTAASWSHTCSGSDRYLVVGVASEAAASAVTYNSVSMTLLGTGSGSEAVATLWGLINPSSGSNTVSVTGTEVAGGSISWTGVHQTTATGTAATASGSGANLTVDVTGTATDEIVVDHGTSKDDAGSPADSTVGANQTARYNSGTVRGGPEQEVGGMGSHEAGNGGTVTMSWTSGAATPVGWGMVAVALKPAAGGGGADLPVRLLALTGAGL